MSLNLPLRLVTLVWIALAYLPAPWLEAVASFGGWLHLRLARRSRRRLFLNLERVYSLPRHSEFAKVFAAQVFRQQFLIALETLRQIRRPGCIQVRGFDELKAQITAAEAAGLGHMLVTAHVGSWELCAYYAQKAASKPLHVLAKPSRSRLLTAFLGVLRERMGTHVLWTDKKTLLRDMLEALRRREALGFVMDQKPEGRSGPVVPFLGVETEFVFGPEKLARKVGCPVIAIFCVREGPLTYRLLGETLFGPPGPQGPGADPACAQSTADAVVTARCAEAIERVIRAYPEQWTWTYKRWRETI